MKKIRFNIIAVPVYIAIIVFFLWHIYAIRTTIKKHPEYKKKKENKKRVVVDRGNPFETQDIVNNRAETGVARGPIRLRNAIGGGIEELSHGP